MAKRNRILFSAAGALLAAAIFIVLPLDAARAQEVGTDLPEGVSQTQLDAALADLSSTTGQTFASHEAAREFCNVEANFNLCADVGKRNNLYAEGEVNHVDAVLDELKGQVLTDLQACRDEGCLVAIAERLATRLARTNPKAAEALAITREEVTEKRAIAETVRTVGVSVRECRDLETDTAPVEQLRACARLAKQLAAREEVRSVSTDQGKIADRNDKLLAAYESGAFQGCGDPGVTLDETLQNCGNYCFDLKDVRQGEAAIPAVCLALASTVFAGEGGEAALRNAYRQAGDQVRQADARYENRAANVVFTTTDGRTLGDLREVGRYIEAAGERGDVDAVRKGMGFLVAQGFTRPEDAQFAIRMVEKIAARGSRVDFDTCEADPAACADVVHEEDVNNFDEFRRLEAILAQNSASPRECGSKGPSDSVREEQCRLGTERALTQVNESQFRSENVRRVIAGMRARTAEGKRYSDKKSEIFSQGGPGGCALNAQNPEEACRIYCAVLANGPECIAYATRVGIYQGQRAVERYQEYESKLRGTGTAGYRGEGPYPGFVPPGQGGVPPGQIPGFTEPGPGFGGEPSETCYRAIQSGDHVAARTACAARVVFIVDQRTTTTFTGDNRDDLIEQCVLSGGRLQLCRSQVDQYLARQRTQPQSSACPALPTVDQNECRRNGGTPRVTYQSAECGAYYACDFPQPQACQTGYYRDATGACVPTGQQQCAQGTYSAVRRDGTQYCASTSVVENCTNGVDDDGDQYIDAEDPGCGGHGQACPEGQTWNGSACAPGFCESSYTTQAACNASGQCTWSGSRCVAGGGTGGGSCYSRTEASCAAPCVFYRAGQVVPGQSSAHSDTHCDDFAHGQAGGGGGTGSACGSNTTSASCEANPACDWNNNACAPTAYSYEGDAAGECSDGVDNDSDGLIDSADYGCGGTGGGGGSCPTSVAAFLGADCHQMYSDAAGPIYCNGPMNQSMRANDTAVSGTCQAPGGVVSSCGTYISAASCESSVACDWSVSSNTCVASTSPVPAAPVSVSATIDATTGKPHIFWTDASTNETYFKIFGIIPPSSNWAAIYEFTPPISGASTGVVASHIHTAAPSSGTASYRVQACNSSSCSQDSNVATVTLSTTAAPACSDGIDNDSDGLIDLADTGCSSSTDTSETPETTNVGTSHDQVCNSNWPGSYSLEDGTGNCFLGSQYRTTNGTGTTQQCTGPNTPVGGCTGGTASGSCLAWMTPENVLGSSCHSMGNAYFNGPMTNYLSLSATQGTAPTACSATWISSCSTSGGGTGCGSYTAQASCQGATDCSWAGTYCYASGSGGGTSSCGTHVTSSSCTATTGCAWSSTSNYCYYSSGTGGGGTCGGIVSQSTCSQTTGCAWSSTSNSCYSSGTSGSSCPSGYHYMAPTSGTSSGYCMSDANSTSCQPFGGGTAYTCPTGGTGGGTGTPAAPTNVAASVSGSSVSVTWSAPAGTAPALYKLYRNGNFLADVTATSYTDSTAPSGTSVSYSVQACPTSTTSVSSCSPYAVGNSVTVGGGSTSGSVCGNGTCESGETTSSCPADCGSTSSCSTPSNCFVESTCTGSGWYWYSSACWSSPQSSGGTTACNNNGICESGESTGSCPGDCGSYTGGGSGSSCSTPSNCFVESTCTGSGWHWYNNACWSSPQTTGGGSTGGASCPSYATQSTCQSASCTWGWHLNNSPHCDDPTHFSSPHGAFAPYCPSNHLWNGAHCVVSATPRIAQAPQPALPARRTIADVALTFRDFFAHILKALFE